MRVLLHDVFGAMPAALAIWLVLVGMVIVGCGFTAAPAVRRQRRAGRVQAEAVRLRRVQLGAQAAELNRHADEVAATAAVSLRHEATTATARAQLAAEIVAVRTGRSDRRFATASGSVLVPGH